MSGDWKKAEEILNRALDLAFETTHPQLAMILAALGEIEFLRGDTNEAEKILTQSPQFCRNR